MSDALDEEPELNATNVILKTTLNPTTAKYSSNSGVFTNYPCGAAIKNISLPKGSYIIIPSTFEPIEKEFMLLAYIHPTAAVDPEFQLRRIR